MTVATWPQRPPLPTAEQIDEVRTAATTILPDGAEIGVEIDPGGAVPVLVGTVPTWADAVAAGHAASTAWRRLGGHADVVSDLQPAGSHAESLTATDAPDGQVDAGSAASTGGREAAGREEPGALPAVPTTADVIVVGGGICGLAVADRLVAPDRHVLVLESGNELGGATTSWNNGMVHPGHDPLPGTLKARLNVAGNAAWTEFARGLGIALLRTGSMIAALADAEIARIEEYRRRAEANGVPGAAVLSGDLARELEPRLSRQVRAALWTPSTAYVEPAEACRALAARIRAGGGTICLRARVDRILTEGAAVRGVQVARAEVLAPVVINAAGVHADTLAATAGVRRYSIHPRRGTLILFDPGEAERYPIGIGPVPVPYSKGGGMTARPSGLTTGGPTAVEQQQRIPQPATAAEIEHILDLGSQLLPQFPLGSAVHVGTQVRAATYHEDFIVGPVPGVNGLVDVAGTQSPALASSPAIAAEVAHLLASTALISTEQTP